MPGEQTAHDILVDLDTEYEGKLLSDPPTSESRIAAFHFNDGGNQRQRGALGPGLRRSFCVKSKRYLRFTKARWNAMMADGLNTMAVWIAVIGSHGQNGGGIFGADRRLRNLRLPGGIVCAAVS
ncbi:MAG: hypothetical protein ABW034_10180 [Steroidobacteraceae bacterium]